jgi:hypothetical protein
MPIHHHNRVVVLIFNQEAIGFLSAGHLVPGQELGGPHDAVEDQAESPANEGRCPVSLFGAVEQIALVPGIDGHVTLSLLDAQLPAGKVSEADRVGLALVALVPMRSRSIGVIHRAAVPRDRDMFACVV